MKNIFTIFLLTLSLHTVCFSQEKGASADELLAQARTLAFEQKDYQQAIALIKQALTRAPDYTDLSVFLGRLYTWSDEVDSARSVFEGLMQKKVTDADMYLAYGSLLYWNDLTDRAIEVVNEGLMQHPNDQDLLLLKAKISYSSNNYTVADKVVESLIRQNPLNAEARALSKKIKNYADENAIGIQYTFTHFDKQFADNWQILTLSYKRATPIGSVILKTNYANKFDKSGYQFELEAYPRISEMFYMYVGTGYSANVGIFPKYRTGASLYANLPNSFEGELGFRQLYFSDNIWMYTASVGKYYKNFWFNLRTYLTPGNSNISHSYTGTARYYTKGANDYIGFQIGTEWRKQNSDFEPARKLLEQIKTTKTQLIKVKKIKKEKPLPPITEEEIPFELPEGWVWCRLGDVSTYLNGNAFDSEDFQKHVGVKCIKITNVGVGEIISTEDTLPNKFDEKYKGYLVYTNDVVMALTRPYISEGLKVSLCPESYNKSLLNQRVAVIRGCKGVSNSYIYKYLKSDFVLEGYKKEFESKSQQPNLKSKHITDLLFPLAPSLEQEKIIEKLGILMEKCKILETEITKSEQYVKVLMQAVLKEAFESEKELVI